jgi:molybdate transport system regulatory protein
VRNRLAAEVLAVAWGPLNARVELQLAGGDRLAAVLTRPSAEALRLSPGRRVSAWLQEPGIVLMDGAAGVPAPVSAPHWPVRVIDLRHGGLNLDAALRLPGGSRLQVVVTQAAGQALGLARGRRLHAAVLPSQVVLAVSD